MAVFLTELVVSRGLAAQTHDDTSKSACRQAYESAQLLRRNETLLAAREQLRICGAEACPAITRTDCVRWLAAVESAIPSMVFEARTSVGAVFDVSVTIDGIERVKELDGRPVEVDPGLHDLVFERNRSPRLDAPPEASPKAPPEAPLKQRVILREGEKNQLVVADWANSLAADTGGVRVPRSRVERPIPPSVHMTAGIAALGLADFAIAATWANTLKSDLEASRCAPFCSREQANALRTRYVIADIGLAVGITELATSAVLFLTRPERPVARSDGGSAMRPAHSSAFAVAPLPSGVFVQWRAPL